MQRINFTQDTLNTLKKNARCSFANAVYKLGIKAQQGLKCDDLFKKSVLMDEVNKLLCKYKLDSCISFHPELEGEVSSWYFGIGSFSGTITYYMVIDGVETFLGSGTSVSTIVDDINNNTDASGVTAVLGEGGYFTIYSPVGCFVKADLYGVKSPSGTIPASQIVFTKGKCPQEETCVDYTEEELNCVTPQDLQVLYEFTHKYKETLAKSTKKITSQTSSNSNSKSSDCCNWGSIGGSIGNQADLISYLNTIEKNLIGVYDENTLITSDLKNLKFSGSGVTATNSNGTVTVTIPGGSGGSTTLMVDISNADLLSAINSDGIEKGVIYRVTDAIGGVVHVIGRSINSVTRAAYREGKFDTTLITVTGIYGNYNPSTNTFVEQGRIATAPTVNEDITHGYYEGQILTTLDTIETYICNDSTSGAAGWDLLPTSVAWGNITGNIEDQTDVGARKDTNGNVYLGTGHSITLGTGALRNTFYPASAVTVGTSATNNVFGAKVSGFIFGNNLKNVTIESGAIGVDYTASPSYDFLYNKAYSANIFLSEAGEPCHRYFDIANDRIVVTNLTTLAVTYIGGSTGSGDVVGPASSTNNNIVLFDGTTGKLIKDSGTTLASKVDANSAITGATKTKITYDSKGLVTSATDATTADIADSTDKRYVTDANLTKINAIDQAVSSAEKTTWNGKQDALVSGTNIKTLDGVTLLGSGNIALGAQICSAGAGTTVTGTTTNTFSKGVLIPANSRGANYMPRILVHSLKTGSGGTATFRLYANTTNDILGSPILIATYAAAAGARNIIFERNPYIEVAAGTGNGTQVLLATNTSTISDILAGTAGMSTLAIDWTSNFYLVVAVQLANSADSATVTCITLH